MGLVHVVERLISRGHGAIEGGCDCEEGRLGITVERPDAVLVRGHMAIVLAGRL